MNRNMTDNFRKTTPSDNHTFDQKNRSESSSCNSVSHSNVWFVNNVFLSYTFLQFYSPTFRRTFYNSKRNEFLSHLLKFKQLIYWTWSFTSMFRVFSDQCLRKVNPLWRRKRRSSDQISQKPLCLNVYTTSLNILMTSKNICLVLIKKNKTPVSHRDNLRPPVLLKFCFQWTKGILQQNWRFS